MDDGNHFDWRFSDALAAGVSRWCTRSNFDNACTAVALSRTPAAPYAVPTRFLVSTFRGVGAVNAASYLSSAAAQSWSRSVGPGYIISSQQLPLPTGAGARVGYMMTGSQFSAHDQGGSIAYVGIAHYLNFGPDPVYFNHNRFFGANKTNANNLTGHNGPRPVRAPLGPFNTCVSKILPDGSCGPKLELAASEYKFSIFGMLFDEFMAFVNKISGANHIVVRMRLETIRFKVRDLQVNNRPYDVARVNDDVSSLSFATARGRFHFDFPKWYNVGRFPHHKRSGKIHMSTTRSVKIRVHSADDVRFFVDYLFDTDGMEPGAVFVYDPTVRSAPSAQKTTHGAWIAAIIGAVGLLLFALVVVTVLIGKKRKRREAAAASSNKRIVLKLIDFQKEPFRPDSSSDAAPSAAAVDPAIRLKNVKWTAEENAELLRIRTVHPDWTDSQVANAMSTARTPTQVHNHWWDKVNPTLRWDAWTTQEDGALLKGRNLGLKWSEIVKTSPCLANRSNTAAKNRWHLLQRKGRAGEAAGGPA